MRTMHAVAGFVLLATPMSLAQSNVDPANKWSWGENVGWLNWHDAGTPIGGQGVRVHATYLSGLIWAENVGWINLGDGDPGAAGGGEDAYANVAGNDYGVNRDPMSNELFGMAWGENVGWINFDGGALATPANPARVEIEGCRLRGLAWGENVGWINFDTGDAAVRLAGSVCSACGGGRGDADCDGGVDFFDIDPFLLALFDPPAYSATYCGGSSCAADANCDGGIDFFDIDPFLTCLFGDCLPCP